MRKINFFKSFLITKGKINVEREREVNFPFPPNKTKPATMGVPSTV